MKLFYAFLLFLCASLSVSAINPVVRKAHSTTMKIGQQTIAGASLCSATAIGPHAILTATHCEMATDEIAVRRPDGRAKIVGHIRDKADHTIILLSGITFTDFADIKLTETLAITDDVFMFGNPFSMEDIFRKGIVVGYKRSVQPAPGVGYVQIVLFDFQAFPGDSGAGVFNNEGQVVGVLSFSSVADEQAQRLVGFPATFRLLFTPDDIAKARAFEPEPEK